jgi:uncharacterized protein (TIGR03067 family)
MRTRLLSLLALVLFTAFTFGQGEAQKELEKFQGTWVVESVVADGKEVPSDVVKAFKMTFKGDTYTVLIGLEKTEGTFRIDPTKEPKTMDIIPDNGPDRDRIQRSIYAFDGDKLKICGAQPGKDRPTSFETKDKVGYSLMILRKAN